MDSQTVLRGELDRLLTGKGAHADFEAAANNFPIELRGVRPPKCPHSAWELLEHIRIAQWDMLEFCRNPGHQSPDWPGGYWPPRHSPDTDSDWDKSVDACRRDLAAMRDLIKNSGDELFRPIEGGEGQTLLREALQMADHNAYHVGEMVLIRRLLGAWKAE